MDNKNKTPVVLKWEPDIEGRGVGWPICPSCGEMPYSTEQCYFCGQRFVQDERVQAFNEPDEEYTGTCPCCGKETFVYVRAKSNGHLHGRCTSCGARMIE